MPGEAEPDSKVADECAKLISQQAILSREHSAAFYSRFLSR